MNEMGLSSSHTLLLLGGTGFIGANLARELRRAGHDVLVAGRSAVPEQSIHALALDDVEAIMALIAERGVDTVVHLASSMIPSSTQADFFAEQEAIVRPVMALAVRLAQAGVDLVYLSSGGTVYGATPAHPVAEEHPCAPISFYGQSKLGVEQFLCFLGRRAGLRHLIVRPSNPYGRGQALHGAQGLVSVALGKIRGGLPLEVWGDGRSVRDYIHIDDLTRSIREMIEGGVRDTVVNVGSGVGHSLLEVVDFVRHATGRRLDLVFHPSRGVDVPYLVLDITRLRALNMDHARSLEQGIYDYVAELGMSDG